MISGRTTLIAHLGYPTETFKAPMIYNPYFEKAGIDAVVVPMGVRAGEAASIAWLPRGEAVDRDGAGEEEREKRSAKVARRPWEEQGASRAPRGLEVNSHRPCKEV